MSFKNIIGQERATEFLDKTIRRNTLPHALLFYGPNGVGKHTTALTLAKILNCTATENDFCNQCNSCHKINTGSHPDVRNIDILETKDTVSITQIRALIKDIQFKPWEGKCKVYILSSVEKMKTEAINCLLKTLEEPPANVVLILLTINKNMLPLTIVSRCQLVPFSMLTKEQINTILISQHGVPFDEAERLTAYSYGSVGQAIELYHDGFLQEKDELKKFWNEVDKLNIEELFESSAKWKKIKYQNTVKPEDDVLDDSGEDSDEKTKSKKSDSTKLFLHWLLIFEQELKTNYRQVIPIMKQILQAKKQLRSNVNKGFIMDNLALEMYRIKKGF